MDAATLSVLGALGVAGITSTGMVAVAFINNRVERTSSADEGVEAVLRQRVELGEDRLEAAGLEIARKNETILELKARLARCICGKATP